MQSIIQNDNFCYICAKYKSHYVKASDTHHCFGAANRNKSEADGLTVRLCRSCHNKVHDHCGFYYRELQKIAEQAWLDEYHLTIGDFISRYGKNYL